MFECCAYRCGRDYCDSTEIMKIADAMASNGMKDAGYEYINLDGIVQTGIIVGIVSSRDVT